MGYVKAGLIGLAMLVFGLTAFVMAVGALILSPLFPNLRYRSNQFFIVPFSVFTRWLVGIKLVVLNKNRVSNARPAVMVGNHQTGLDFALISQACQGGMLIVAKRELKNIPIFGWFFSIAGNLLIDRSNPATAKKQMDDARLLLKEKKLNLAIFPEGTRNKTDTMLPFKKGAFHLAVSMGLPIIPIVCSNLKSKGIWEKAELNGGHVVVSVMEPIPTQSVSLNQVDSLMNEIRARMMQEYERITELAKSYDEGLSDRSASCC